MIIWTIFNLDNNNKNNATEFDASNKGKKYKIKAI